MTSLKSRAIAIAMGLVTAWPSAMAFAKASPTEWETAVTKMAQRQVSVNMDALKLRQPHIDITVLPMRGATPACTSPWRIDTIDVRHLARLRYSALCSADGKRYAIMARAKVTAEVLVAAHDIAAGQTLSDADISMTRRTLASIDQVQTDTSAIAGRVARRAIRAGEPIEKRHLHTPRLVKRGQSVEIVAQLGPVSVTSVGVALEDGSQDDTIRVRPATARSPMLGRVLANGRITPAGTGKL